MNNLKNILGHVLSMGQTDFFRSIGNDDTTDTKIVAAGDPALPIRQTISSNAKGFDLSDYEDIDTRRYEKFMVTGNSMLPKGIKDGDCLFVESCPDGYHSGDFIIVSVDKEYYRKYNPKHPIYNYKLRYALYEVNPTFSVSDIIDSIKDFHYEIYLKENQEQLVKKWNKARTAYPYEPLMLSTTYHDGELRYSFHPCRLIVGKAYTKKMLCERQRDTKCR